MAHVHTWIPFTYEFGKFVRTENTAGPSSPEEKTFQVFYDWEPCPMADAEGMVVKRIVCPDCGKGIDMQPPEGRVEEHTSGMGPELEAILSRPREPKGKK